MTKGPWKYQKAENHHHVLMGIEVLDINHKEDAKAIALVPQLIQLVKLVDDNNLLDAYTLAGKLRKKLKI